MTQATGEILKKIRQVEIRTNRMVSDVMAGAYKSVFKGRGMSFEEVRLYVPGDDVRAIDWNVTAKTGSPHIKVFREERELTILIALDLSASTNFASSEQSKREYAAEIASVLAFSATRNNDKVGLILFTDKIEKFIAPKKGRQHSLQIIRDLYFHEAEGSSTDIPQALQYLSRVIPHRSVVFLISDFLQSENGKLLDANNEKSPLLRALEVNNQRHDLIPIYITDPIETTLPDVGFVTLQDSETNEILKINTNSQVLRDHYAKKSRERIATIRKLFKQKGLSALFLQTNKPYISELRQFLETRTKAKK